MNNDFLPTSASSNQWQISGIILINWYLFDCEYIPLRGVTAFCGGNGSGKSTILDAMQLVLHGGDTTKAVFNSSAERVRKAEGRKLIDYCLGMLAPRADGGEPTRERADTRIALVFTCPATGESLTAGLAYSASAQDDKEDMEGMFIVPGKALDEKFFVETAADGKTYVMEWPSLRNKAKAEGLTFDTYDTSTRFCHALGLALKPNYNHYAQHETYRRALKTGMSLKEINDPNEFVRDHILDKEPLRIDQLRADIELYRMYRDKIVQIEAEIDDLGKVIVKADDHAQKVRQLAFAEASELKGRCDGAALHRGQLQTKHDEVKAKHDSNVSYRTRSGQIITELEEDLRSKERIAGSSETAHEIRAIDLQVDLKIQRQSEITKAIRAFRGTVAEASAVAEHAARIGVDIGEAAQFAGEAAELADPALSADELVTRIPGMADLVKSAAKAVASFLGGIRKAGDDRMHALRIAQDGAAAVQEKINKIKAGGSPVDRKVELFRNELQARGLQPKLLCDLVDVKDESWRDAVEALLGRAAQAIIVAPEKVDRAIEAQKSDRNTFGDCVLVYTKDALNHDRPASDRSLAAMVSTSDKFARAFVDVRLGSYVRVDSIAGFEGERSAVTRDCQAKSAMSVRTLRIPTNHVLGKAAQLASLPRLEMELAGLKSEIADHATYVKSIQAILRCADSMAKAAEAADSAVGDAEDYKQVKRDIDRLKESKAALIEGEDDGLLKEIEEIKAELVERKTEAAQIDGEIGSLRESLGQIKGKLEEAEKAAAQSESDLAEWREANGDDLYVAAMNDFATRQARISATEKGGEAAVLSRLAQEAKLEAVKLREAVLRADKETLELWLKYMQKYPSSAGAPGGMPITAIREKCAHRKQMLVETELVEYRERSEVALQDVEKGFKEDFLHRLGNSLKGMQRKLESYNAHLRTKSFNGDQYWFERKIKPEYQSIVALANSDVAISSVLSGHVPDKHQEAVVILTDLINDPAFDISKFEDYRGFYEYDIIIKNPAMEKEMRYSTRKNVGSGGEGQAPFYIAVATALATAFHGSMQNASIDHYGFAPALFDEAFSKLDGVNIRQVMQFMQDLHLQVIVAAPTEKRTSFMGNVDTMVDITKDPAERSVFIEVTGVGTRYKDEIAKVDPNLKTVDDFKDARNTATSEVVA